MQKKQVIALYLGLSSHNHLMLPFINRQRLLPYISGYLLIIRYLQAYIKCARVIALYLGLSSHNLPCHHLYNKYQLVIALYLGLSSHNGINLMLIGYVDRLLPYISGYLLIILDKVFPEKAMENGLLPYISGYLLIIAVSV